MTPELDTISFRTAKKHVELYSDEFHEDVMQSHREALDCLNCEAFLQVGIDAFAWLLRADRELRQRAIATSIETPQEAQHTLEDLCRAWLAPAEYAERWIAWQEQRGHMPGNVELFRRCCAEMSAIVEFLDEPPDHRLPAGLATLRDAAIEEHDIGQTAEFL